jgi:hypothetical protein
VRLARVGVTDSLDYGQAATFKKLRCLTERRVKAQTVGDTNQPIRPKPQARAVPGVTLIVERNDGIDSVVTAVELDNYQDAAAAVGFGSTSGLCQKTGHGRGQGKKGGRTQELATAWHWSILRRRFGGTERLTELRLG